MAIQVGKLGAKPTEQTQDTSTQENSAPLKPIKPLGKLQPLVGAEKKPVESPAPAVEPAESVAEQARETLGEQPTEIEQPKPKPLAPLGSKPTESKSVPPLGSKLPVAPLGSKPKPAEPKPAEPKKSILPVPRSPEQTKKAGRLGAISQRLAEVVEDSPADPDDKYKTGAAMMKKKQDRANSFIRGNARYTAKEIKIMKSLGMNFTDYRKYILDPRTPIEEKEKLVKMKSDTLNLNSNERGHHYTYKDRDVIQFLAVFKYATMSILSNLHGVKVRQMYYRIQRLMSLGLVLEFSIPGMMPLYVLSAAGMGLSGHDYKPQSIKQINLQNIQPTLGPAYIASCLWRHSFNVLQMDELGYNREGRNGPELGEELVSEMEIRASIGKRLGDGGEAAQAGVYRTLSGYAVGCWKRWDIDGSPPDESPELSLDNRYLFANWNDGSYPAPMHHVPDLVIFRPRKGKEPEHIAIEVERASKSVQQYALVMTSYKIDERLYSKVIWITSSESTANKLVAACDEAHIPLGERVDIQRLWEKGPDGEPVVSKDMDFTKI